MWINVVETVRLHEYNKDDGVLETETIEWIIILLLKWRKNGRFLKGE